MFVSVYREVRGRGVPAGGKLASGGGRLLLAPPVAPELEALLLGLETLLGVGDLEGPEVAMIDPGPVAEAADRRVLQRAVLEQLDEDAEPALLGDVRAEGLGLDPPIEGLREL